MSNVSLCFAAWLPCLELSNCSFHAQGAMAADQEQFYQILTTLLSTDNNIRTQAEVSPLIRFFMYFLLPKICGRGSV